MKKKKLLLITFVLALTTTAFKITDDILTRIGIEQQIAQWHIIHNVIGRLSTGPMELGVEDGPANSVYKQAQSFQIPRAKLLANIITGDKAGAAKELCEYVKKYINSEDFMTEYMWKREDAMPLTDQGSSLTTLRKNIIVHNKNINNYKTDTKYVAEQQKQLDETQKRIDGIMMTAKKNFSGKDVWEKTYPADPSALIKSRLQEYLQLVATVDFNAALTAPDKYKVKKFVNPAYEKKSRKWKTIYRAGKEVNDVVTAFVKDWLKGEIISKEKTKMANNMPSGKAENETNKTEVNNNTNSVISSKPTEKVVQETPPAEKKAGFKKLQNKLGTIIKN